MAKSKTVRYREAGPLVQVCAYPRASARDDDRARAAKRKKTSELMQKHNDKTSRRELELLMASNFVPGDIVGTATFDDAHLPKDRDAVLRRWKYGLDKVRKAWKSKGVELRGVWAVEHRHGEGRWHIHFLINAATGQDYEAIRKAWHYGGVALTALRVDAEKNFASLAAYYCKEGREKLGLKIWSGTQNLRKPRNETERVEASYRVVVPEGAVVLERYTVETPWGVYEYVMYMLPWLLKRRVKARVRRRKD